MKKRLIVSWAIVIGAIIGVGLYFINEAIILYRIDYFESVDEHNDTYDMEIKHEITIYKNLIKVKTIRTARNRDDTSSDVEKRNYKYSKRNMKKLENVLNNEFNITKRSNVVLYGEDIISYQKNIIDALLENQYAFEIAAEKYKYFLTLHDDYDSYIFYLKDDGQIEVQKIISDEKDYFTIADLKSYSIDFSEKNMNLLREYIVNQVEKYGENNYYELKGAYKDNEKIINSMKYNNESYLKDISQIPQLEYIISYEGPDEKCTYYSIELYSDNSFEYIFTHDGHQLIIFPGEYSDIDRVFVNPNSNDFYIKIKDSKTNSYLPYNKGALYNLFKSFNNSVNSDLTDLKCYSEIK